MDSGWQPGKSGGRSRGGKKPSSADFDLGDLLGDSDSDESPKKSKPSSTKKTTPSKGKKSTPFDDDFYSQLAADAADDVTESEVSEADAAELAKTLDDLDDLDAGLFTSKKKPQSKPEPKKQAAREVPKVKETLSAVEKTPEPKASPMKKSTGPKGKPIPTEMDFGEIDEDDPLKGLLSDDEDDKPKKKAQKKQLTKPTSPVKKEDTGPVGTPSVHLERPPTRSGSRPVSAETNPEAEEIAPKLAPTPRRGNSGGNKPKKTINFDSDSDEPKSPKQKESAKPKSKKPADDIDFGDDSDVLGGMGLDDTPPKAKEPPKPSSPAKKPAGRRKKDEDLDFDDSDVLGGMGFDDSPRVKKKEEEESKPAKSIMDSLLGKGSVDKHLQKPAEKKEFVLDKKYAKPKVDDTPKEATEEDFTFGDYMPSAATGSRPTSRRSVRFQDEDDIFGDKPPSRGSLGGGRRSRAGMSATIDGGDDWLSLASGETPKQSDQSESKKQISEKTPEKPKSANGSDWLGLSADSPPKGADESDWLGFADKNKQKLPEKKDKNDDWLGLGGSQKSSQPQTMKGKESDDWLGLGESKTPEKSKTETDNKDWLGLGNESPKSPKRLPPKQEPKPKAEAKSDDWLGTGQGSAGKQMQDHLGLGDEVPISRDQSISKKDDLFSTPPKRDPSSLLPWEGGPRRRAGMSPTVTPQEQLPTAALAATPQSIQPVSTTATGQPPSQTPAQPVSPLLSPKLGISAQIEQLQKLQQQQDELQRQKQLEIQKQEEMMRKQQQEMVEKQLQQQAELQKQLQQQQEQQMLLMQQKQKEMMEQQLKEQQMRMEMESQRMAASLQLQTPTPFMPSPQQYTLQAPSPGLPGVMYQGSPGMSHTPGAVTEAQGTIMELEGKIRKLEMEKEHLEMNIGSLKKRHQEEIETIEITHKNRMLMIEDSYKRREERLKEEADLLVAQNQNKVCQMEQERNDVIASYQRKIEDWERDRTQELERLKDIHRSAIADIRRDHEETVDRLKQVRQQEMEAVNNATSHSRSLQAVLNQVHSNVRDLGDLQQRVDIQHHTSLDERELAARTRDEHLKVLQERLLKQQEETDIERGRLQQLVAKLEVQLREQNRQLEEEKWRVKQEQNKLSALQTSTEEERKTVSEQLSRERTELQKAKDNLLSEQKAILSQLYEERRAIATERADLNASQRQLFDKNQRESIRNVQAEAELEGTLKSITEGKARLTAQSEEMAKEQQKIASEKLSLEQQKQALQIEKDKMADLALRMKQRSQEIEEMCLSGAQAREDGERALAEAKKIESEQAHRLHTIQVQLNALREKERQIAEERVTLAKEKRDLKDTKGSVICTNCQTPVKDVQPHHTQGSPLVGNAQFLPSPVFDQVASSIERDKSIRMWKINADKDSSFLEEEGRFLETLKYSPYHSPSPQVAN